MHRHDEVSISKVAKAREELKRSQEDLRLLRSTWPKNTLLKNKRKLKAIL